MFTQSTIYSFTPGCTVAAVFVLAVGYSPNPIMGVAFLCIGVGITGVNATGYAVNLLDIAPRFAGVIMGITNVFGSLPGFLSPQIVGIITVNKVRWCLIFFMVLSCSICDCYVRRYIFSYIGLKVLFLLSF